ncbi:hypothetical protein D6C79_06582, partial [Aureobasidium pullulans]
RSLPPRIHTFSGEAVPGLHLHSDDKTRSNVYPRPTTGSCVSYTVALLSYIGSSTDGLYTRKVERSNMAYRLGIHLSKGMSYTIDCLKKHDERNKEEQEGYKTRKERPSANPGLLLLLEVQLLQCGYDRKESH